MQYLKFGKGNGKLNDKTNPTLTFALPAGHFCPMAKACLSKVSRITGKLKDGKHTQFRCFGASLESVYTSMRNSVWTNVDVLRNAGLTDTFAMSTIMIQSLMQAIGRRKPKYVRIHSTGGDFFNAYYLQAWIATAQYFPEITFYAYTKMVTLVSERQLPQNFVVTYSRGGHEDSVITEKRLKEAVVVYKVEQAELLGLEIDVDDSLARDRNYRKSFALLIHGNQPKGSEAGKANRENIKNGVKKQLLGQL
jgi:hypothetical protein